MIIKIGIFLEDISYGGGLEIVSERLCKAFLSRDIDASVLSLKPKHHKFYCDVNTIYFNFTAKSLKKAKIRKQISMKIKEDGYTHIIFQTGAPYSFFSNMEFFKMVEAVGIKVYITFHNSPKTFISRFFHQGESLYEYLLKFLKTIFYNIPRCYLFFAKANTSDITFVTLSKGTQFELKKYFGLNSLVIPNYFNLSQVNLNDNKKEKIFVFIGRMDLEQKNIFYLIDAWKNINNKNGWSFYMIGPDSNDSKIIKKIEKSGIKIISYTNNNIVLDYLKKSSVLLLASIYEGFPTVVLEAVATGNAIITTKYDGFSDEIVHDEENGFVIKDKYHTEKFTEAMQKLILNNDLLLQMQIKSLNIYQDYIKTDVVQLWKEEFDS